MTQPTAPSRAPKQQRKPRGRPRKATQNFDAEYAALEVQLRHIIDRMAAIRVRKTLAGLFPQ